MKAFLLMLATLIFASVASAAAPPVIVFTGTPLNGPPPVSTTLSWSVTGAVSCTASGGWTGSKALPSGTETVTGITAQKAFTLTCLSASDTSAVVSWTAPTQRTDGSPLTNLAKFTINYGQTSGTLTQTKTITDVSSTSFTLTGLTGSNVFAAMTSTDADGIQSVPSNIVSKPLAPGQSAVATVTVTPTAPPNPPGNVTLTVLSADAFSVIYDRHAKHYNVGNQIGTATLGAACKEDPVLGDGYYTLVSPNDDCKMLTGRKKCPKLTAVVCGAAG